MSYRNISISAILHALAIAHRNRFTDSETPYKTWLRIRKEKLIAAGVLAALRTPEHIKNFWS